MIGLDEGITPFCSVMKRWLGEREYGISEVCDFRGYAWLFAGCSDGNAKAFVERELRPYEAQFPTHFRLHANLVGSAVARPVMSNPSVGQYRSGNREPSILENLHAQSSEIMNLLFGEDTHIYLCLDEASLVEVERVFKAAAVRKGQVWQNLRQKLIMRNRWHVQLL